MSVAPAAALLSNRDSATTDIHSVSSARQMTAHDRSARTKAISAAVSLGLGLTGCASGPTLPALLSTSSQPATSSPDRPEAPADVRSGTSELVLVASEQQQAGVGLQEGRGASITTGALPPPAATVAGSGAQSLTAAGTRIEVYEHLARRALSCWVGPASALRAGYVFAADVPPSTGNDGGRNAAEIGIHERSTTATANRGLRAYWIKLTETGSGSVYIESANSRLNPDIAVAMGRDLQDWARGGSSCFTAAAAPYIAAPQDPIDQKSAKAAGKRTKKNRTDRQSTPTRQTVPVQRAASR